MWSFAMGSSRTPLNHVVVRLDIEIIASWYLSFSYWHFVGRLYSTQLATTSNPKSNKTLNKQTKSFQNLMANFEFNSSAKY